MSHVEPHVGHEEAFLASLFTQNAEVFLAGSTDRLVRLIDAPHYHRRQHLRGSLRSRKVEGFKGSRRVLSSPLLDHCSAAWMAPHPRRDIVNDAIEHQPGVAAGAVLRDLLLAVTS